MLNSFDLKLLKSEAIIDYPKDSLADLQDVKIDAKKSVNTKMDEFFVQIKNPYLFRVGDMRVKVSFSGNRTFCDALVTAISNGENYQSNLG